LELAYLPGGDLVAVGVPLALNADAERDHGIHPEVAFNVDASVSGLTDSPKLGEAEFGEQALAEVLKACGAEGQDCRSDSAREFDVVGLGWVDWFGRLFWICVVVRCGLTPRVLVFRLRLRDSWCRHR
jgi:hypothetical protein